MLLLGNLLKWSEETKIRHRKTLCLLDVSGTCICWWHVELKDWNCTSGNALSVASHAEVGFCFTCFQFEMCFSAKMKLFARLHIHPRGNIGLFKLKWGGTSEVCYLKSNKIRKAWS